MPSLGDSVFIFMLALMLFGPKKLPQLARQLGKLMAEFRRASNDFRMQMEDELRLEEQKEHQKKVDALAPPPSATPDPAIPTEDPPHPHLPAPVQVESPEAAKPIAESGSLIMRAPSSGLPMESRAKRHSSAEPVASPASDGTHANGSLDPDGHFGTTAYVTPHHLIAQDQLHSSAGISSEEPVEALSIAPAEVFETAPDRSHPVMVGEGERATHG